MAKLSVIIPVYNQEIFVKRALDSVPASCEIIVIDDGSTDNTVRTVSYFYHKHPELNIRILFNNANMGVSHALNRGLVEATGDYVVSLGSDDYFYPEALERVMREMDGTDLIYFDLLTNEGNVFHLTPETRDTFCGSVKLMRREFIDGTRNREDLRVREDRAFSKELMAKNPTEKYTNIIAKHYNWPRKGSLTYVNSQG